MIGNLRTKTEGASSLTLSYPAAGQPRPHAVAGVSGSTARGFVYDGDGNQQASGNNAAHGFDAENRFSVALDVTPAADVAVPSAGPSCSETDGNGTVNLADVTRINAAAGAGPAQAAYRIAYDLDASGLIDSTDANRELAAFGKLCPSVEQRYSYDANGQLVQRSTGMPGLASTSWTNYIDGIYEITSTGVVTKYYQAFGRTVAMRQAGTLSYPLLDHLGTTVAITDSTGAVTGTARYWPYGAMRISTGVLAPVPPATVPPGTDKLYTGQQMEAGDAALGLYNYKARFYSTTLGRFLSVDPVVGDAYDPQAWNPYSYVGNNPLSRTDPTGERWCNSDDCDPASSSSTNDYSSNAGSGCNTACQWIAAWNAFHPGRCWSCAPTSLPIAGSAEATAAGGVGFGTVVEASGICEAVTVGGCTIAAGAAVAGVACWIWCADIAHHFFSDNGEPAGIGPDHQPAAPVPPPETETRPDLDYIPDADVRALRPEELGKIGHTEIGRIKRCAGSPDVSVNRETGELVVPRRGGGYSGTDRYVQEWGFEP